MELISCHKSILNKRFNCNKDFILKVCKGKCCDILKTKCQYKTDNGLCSIYNNKPLVCDISPFNIIDNNLVIRWRYYSLPCYGHGSLVYETFKSSLLKLLGESEYNNLIKDIKSNTKEIYVLIEDEIYNRIQEINNLLKIGDIDNLWKV